MIAIIYFSLMFFLFYIYLGYPLFLVLISFFTKKKIQVDNNYCPIVTLIIAAYNEEKVIEEKIKNSLKIDYPPDKFEIIIFSDASNDRTDEIVNQYRNKGIKLVRYEGRNGKTFCQNETVKLAEGEIIVFSDANSMYEENAVKQIVKYFIDSKVGCVVGELKYEGVEDFRTEENVPGEGVYWLYEQKLKKMENMISSVVTANGSIYAVRKDYYIPLVKEASSDFAEPLKLFQKGYRILYEPESIAWEKTAPNYREEFQRRVRIVSRTFSTFIRDRQLVSIINPFRFGLFSIQFFSHKLLRWLSGLFLLLLIFFNLLLYNYGIFYQFTFWGQIVFYIMAMVGWLTEYMRKEWNFKVTHVAFYFCLSCWAMLVGIFNSLNGNHFITWEVKRS